MKGKCPDCGETFEFPEKDKVDVLLFGNWRKYHSCKKIEVLIFRHFRPRGKGYWYRIMLSFDSMEKLREVEKLLAPLGYKFRFPRR